MNALPGSPWCRWVAVGLAGVLLAGCATRKIDWNTRVGNYTYDQAVLELGPPDKYARLGDGTVVVEWLTYRGAVYSYSPFAYSYSPAWCGPYPLAFVSTYSSPDYFVRLIFGPAGQLKAWKRFAR